MLDVATVSPVLNACGARGAVGICELQVLLRTCQSHLLTTLLTALLAPTLPGPGHACCTPLWSLATAVQPRKGHRLSPGFQALCVGETHY